MKGLELPIGTEFTIDFASYRGKKYRIASHYGDEFGPVGVVHRCEEIDTKRNVRSDDCTISAWAFELYQDHGELKISQPIAA